MKMAGFAVTLKKLLQTIFMLLVEKSWSRVFINNLFKLFSMLAEFLVRVSESSKNFYWIAGLLISVCKNFSVLYELLL